MKNVTVLQTAIVQTDNVIRFISAFIFLHELCTETPSPQACSTNDILLLSGEQQFDWAC